MLLLATPALAVPGTRITGLPDHRPFPVDTQVVQGAPPPKQAPAEQRWARPNDAVDEVFDDARGFVGPRGERAGELPFIRWIWVQQGRLEQFRAASDLLNRLSVNGTTVQPICRGTIARLDLRDYARDDKDLQRLIDLWELLQFDPMFSLLITKDVLNLLDDGAKSKMKVRQSMPRRVWNEKEWKWKEAEGREQRWVEVGKLKDIQVVRFNAPAVSTTNKLEQLQVYCGTQAPIVSWDYFAARAFSSIKDQDNGKDNVFSTLWGGLYYEFAGIRKVQKANKDKGLSDLDQLFIDVGVSKEESFRQVFDRLPSLQRTAFYRSAVTGKMRAIYWFPILVGAQPTKAQSVLFITLDVRNQDVDVGDDPIKNLVRFNEQAFEVIWVGPNGNQKFALYNKQGDLLEQGADKVVSDHRIPSPHTTNLQAGVSCARCHGPDDGWIPFGNDVRTIITRQGGFNSPRNLAVFGDIGKDELGLSIFETQRRIRDWYDNTDFERRRLLSRLRDDNAAAVFRSVALPAAGPWGDKGLTDAVVLSSRELVAAYERDRYQLVDAALALRYMGFVPEKDPLAQLDRLLPPVKESLYGLVPEDATVGALKSGIKVNMWNFGLSYSFMLTRALETEHREKQNADRQKAMLGTLDRWLHRSRN